MHGLSIAKQLAWLVASKTTRNFQSARTAVRHFYSGSRAINNPEISKVLLQLPSMPNMLCDTDIIARFENDFAAWLMAHQWNTIRGLENFEADLSQGATQCFDSFYVRHADKRWRMLRGEYFYHILTAVNLDHDWSFVEDHEQLQTGDAFVISVPFCDTGSRIADLDSILDHCDRQDIPVLLDCAYFPIAKNIDLDLNHSCIHTVAFSLSKTFPIAHARVGMRYTRPGHRDGQKLHSSINYDNRITATVGSAIIENFSSDWAVDNYQQCYDRLVGLLGLTPGDSVLFAEGDQSWQEYGRKSLLETYKLDLDFRLFRNRICLTQLLENIDLVKTCLRETYEITF